MEERVYQFWFGDIASIWPADAVKLAAMYGSAKAVYEAGDDDLRSFANLPEAMYRELSVSKKRPLPADRLKNMEMLGIECVCCEDELYPEKLKELQDKPYMLYYKGSLPDQKRKCVAIIGSRNCSDYGRRSADYFGRELARAGIAIISGMAVGIDGLAQTACLKGGGISYGVLGSGVDVIYPRGNTELYKRLTGKGGVISEYPPGTAAHSLHFPRRNRIISGLADLVLVIEAREKSGTFITVEAALEQGRDVFAVPGRIEDELSTGCNRLIAAGAGMAGCAEDLLYALGIKDRPVKRGGGSRGKKLKSQREVFSGGSRPGIYKALMEGAKSAESLLKILGKREVEIQDLLLELMQLEMEGLIVCRGGNYSIVCS